MAQPVRCDISAGVILRWHTKTRSAVLKNIRQDSLLKQMLENDFWTLLRSENSIVKFTDTIYSCSVAISSRYNLGVNMSCFSTRASNVFFQIPMPIKSHGLIFYEEPQWNKLQIFVHGIKRGLHRRQHVLKQILAKMLGRDFVNWCCPLPLLIT